MQSLEERVRDACEQHLARAAEYERLGFDKETIQLRAVANLLGGLLQDSETITILPAPVVPDGLPTHKDILLNFPVEGFPSAEEVFDAFSMGLLTALDLGDPLDTLTDYSDTKHWILGEGQALGELLLPLCAADTTCEENSNPEDE